MDLPTRGLLLSYRQPRFSWLRPFLPKRFTLSLPLALGFTLFFLTTLTSAYEITLSWQDFANDPAEVAGYNIKYWPTGESAMPTSIAVDVASLILCESNTFCYTLTLSCPVPGITYNFAVTAFAAGGSRESAPSNDEGEVTEVIPASVPLVAFDAIPITGPAPLEVAFTDQSSGTIDTWLWNFGDGTTSTVQDPTHTYTTVGTFTVSLTVSNPEDSCIRTEDSVITVLPAAEGPVLESLIVPGVRNTDWTTVSLSQTYTSMVVVCSPNYDSTSVPLVVRVRNAVGDRYDVRVERADGSGGAISGITVHCAAVEEGIYTEAEHGVKMEAVKFTSTVTDRKGSWVGENRDYRNTYTTPVIVGQVMSGNDEAPSVFWSYGAKRQQPPSAKTLRVGKHVGEDPIELRANETIGYIVIEAGSGTIGATGYTAGVGADRIRGMGNAPPYTYSLSGLTAGRSAIVSQTAMDVNSGSWAVLYGANPVTANSLRLAIDEDQFDGAERKHATEQVAYIVFDIP